MGKIIIYKFENQIIRNVKNIYQSLENAGTAMFFSIGNLNITIFYVKYILCFIDYADMDLTMTWSKRLYWRSIFSTVSIAK